HGALMDFKNGLEDSHNRLASWRNTNCCQWNGIYCDNVTGAVVAIDLHNPHPVQSLQSNLSGEIRPSLVKLKSLRSLDLSFNTFKEIPISKFHVESLQWVAGLVSLKHLAMDGVYLSLVAGSDLILDWLVNISSLQHIDISDSGLYGKIPLGLRDLPKLQSFNLEDNYNLIANCSQLFLKGWERLQVLVLRSNKLNGMLPSTFGNLTSLTYLDLSFNVIEGGIPSSIGELCNLNILDLARNNMTGTLPDFLQGIENCPSRKPLSNMVLFFASYNQLHGKIPDWLVQLENLAGIGFANNLLEGPIPLSIGSLQNLAILVLEGNKLNGTLPDSLGYLSKLSYLDVSSNQLTGMGWLPKPMSMAVASPVIVDLSFNLLDGPLPVITPGFMLLDLSYNRFSGGIPLNISQHMDSVAFLSLSHNQLHDEIRLSLGEMLSVIVIDLSGNNLTGKIPPSLANCSILEVLDLGNNNMFGTVPGSLGKLILLISLHLNDNNFSGDLPSSLRNLLMLETMDLGYNRLSGIIPTWFWQSFPFLRILILRSNAFSGELSPKLSKLGSLQVLDLARNYLTGRIPASLRDLKAIAQVQKKNKYILYGVFGYHYYEERLNVVMKNQTLKYTKTLSLVTSIDLSDNNFTGHMTTFDAIAFTGNPGLCGPPLPLKCLGDDDKKQTGILVPYFILTMKSSWGDVYFDFVDQVIHKLLMRSHRHGINHGQRRRIPRRR
ncbi:LRR receptor-like kinase resistance protein, partial [Trifolium pratense]